jgi:mRNA-degrading endonuclease HigB of HigAB toxin-antitoxin module
MVKKTDGENPSKKEKNSAKEDDIPSWVSDEIQNAKFEKPEELKRAGYILEIYDSDNKIVLCDLCNVAVH